ncbi:unnamed protein product [Linum trigynum]|uniref:Uncharacterized protein n=1 Tax=Linum trigynum TaxID=586398 RepID=A0AAV2CW66_9ROSI
MDSKDTRSRFVIEVAPFASEIGPGLPLNNSTHGEQFLVTNLSIRFAPSSQANQPQFFNVSRNRLSGPIPVTPALVRFNDNSFSGNGDLCGDQIGKRCLGLRAAKAERGMEKRVKRREERKKDIDR